MEETHLMKRKLMKQDLLCAEWENILALISNDLHYLISLNFKKLKILFLEIEQIYFLFSILFLSAQKIYSFTLHEDQSKI